MPMRRAVRATRQAISPRLAISILSNIDALCAPVGFALLQEGRDAFAAFVGRRDGGDAPGGFVVERGVDGPGGDGENEVLRRRAGPGARLEQQGDDGLDAPVELLRGTDFVHEAESPGL